MPINRTQNEIISLCVKTSLLLLLLWISACSEGGNENKLETGRKKAKEEVREDLIKWQQRFYQKIDRGERKKYGRKLLAKYRGFIGRFPKDEKVPEYLYEAASLAHNHLNDYQEAAKLYRLMEERYPEHPKAPVALFKEAVVRMELKEYEQARTKFRALLRRYPEADLAPDARKQLNTLQEKSVD